MNDLRSVARQTLGLVDLTSLNDDDTDASIAALCRQAKSPAGNTAAVCVYPRFVAVARESLLELGASEVRVATVTNFPEGAADAKAAALETEAAVAAGAHEVDVVFPFRALMAGDAEIGSELVKAARDACGAKARLKVILETGELRDPRLIESASRIAVAAGADFIKTSTGKVAVNATLEAARIMLGVIRDAGGVCGFKAAGGIRTTAEAAEYLTLASELLGAAWVSAEHFRFGASSLLSNLLKTLGYGDGVQPDGGY